MRTLSALPRTLMSCGRKCEFRSVSWTIQSMNDDQLFRLILLGGFVIFVPFGVWHRLKARTGEKLDRRQEGLFILITLRLAGLAGMVAFITYLISPASMAWASVPLSRWLRWTGVGFGLIAGCLLVWAF